MGKTTATAKPKKTNKHRKIPSKVTGGPRTGSTRVRMFKALSRVDHPHGLSAAQIKTACAMTKASGHLWDLLREEVSRGRVRQWEDYRGGSAKAIKVYCLSALGKRDLAAGMIDGITTAGSRIGKSWAEVVGK